MRKYSVIVFFAAIVVVLASCQSKEKPNYLKLCYDKPAEDWNQALPIGNGRLGAMVFGNPLQEHLQLNEETIWAGSPYNNINTEDAPYLEKVRNLFFEGKYKEAHDMANNNIKNSQNGMPYQTMGDLYLDFIGLENYTDFYRELDISNATSLVKFNVGDVVYTRETFSSFTDNVLVMKLSASKPASLNFTIALTSLQEHSLHVNNNQLVMHGRTTDHEGVPGQVKFTTILKPELKGGSISVSDTSLVIVDADEVILLLSCGTNFVNYKDISANPDEIAERYLNAAQEKSFDELESSHTHFYKSYFDRVKLDLGMTDSVNNPTNIRIRDFKEGNDPQMAALYFQFGRYLLISSSQPGGQPANLQGIWNDKLFPPWECKYTININCEMNYWPAEVTNLTELNQPLFNMIKELSESGQEGARKLYNARGWVAHHNTDIWRASGIYDRATYGLWQSGSNWLTQHLWQHYLYTGDEAFLKEYYPVMKGAAMFYLDELVRCPNTGYLVIGPSNSPENKYMDLAAPSAGTTMDNQLMFDLFSNVIRSAEILGVDKAFADSLEYAKSQLAPMQIGQHNQLQEWLYDWDRPEDKHRHVSHLYGLYPSNQVSPYRNPMLFNAAKQSLIYRGDESTGWSMGWKVNLWARLLEGNHAYKLIKDQINPAKKPNGEVHGGTYPNLLDAHPPFQIDGNFGCAAGIAEMLVQSHDGFVYILPALPDAWPKGSVSGLKTRGGFEIEKLEWENGEIKTLVVKSELGGNLRLRTNSEILFADGSGLEEAEGENSNSLFAINEIKKPLISEKSTVKPFEPEETYVYDVETEKEKIYSFILK